MTATRIRTLLFIIIANLEILAKGMSSQLQGKPLSSEKDLHLSPLRDC